MYLAENGPILAVAMHIDAYLLYFGDARVNIALGNAHLIEAVDDEKSVCGWIVCTPNGRIFRRRIRQNFNGCIIKPIGWMLRISATEQIAVNIEKHTEKIENVRNDECHFLCRPNVVLFAWLAPRRAENSIADIPRNDILVNENWMRIHVCRVCCAVFCAVCVAYLAKCQHVNVAASPEKNLSCCTHNSHAWICQLIIYYLYVIRTFADCMVHGIWIQLGRPVVAAGPRRTFGPCTPVQLCMSYMRLSVFLRLPVDFCADKMRAFFQIVYPSAFALYPSAMMWCQYAGTMTACNASRL